MPGPIFGPVPGRVRANPELILFIPYASKRTSEFDDGNHFAGKITNLGGLGDRIRSSRVMPVPDPQGKATEATPANLARFRARRAELKRIAAELLAKGQGPRRTTRRVDRDLVGQDR